jgi:hypothetical protein
MGKLKNNMHERYAVSRALLDYSQAEALKFAHDTCQDWKAATVRSYASKIDKDEDVRRRVKELKADTSTEDGEDRSLITGEQLLAKLSSMIKQSSKPSEVKQLTELYLKMREDVERDLRARIPQHKDEGRLGSAEHSRRLNAAVQMLGARLHSVVSSGSDEGESVLEEALHEEGVGMGGGVA